MILYRAKIKVCLASLKWGVNVDLVHCRKRSMFSKKGYCLIFSQCTAGKKIHVHKGRIFWSWFSTILPYFLMSVYVSDTDLSFPLFSKVLNRSNKPYFWKHIIKTIHCSGYQWISIIPPWMIVLHLKSRFIWSIH